jgi:hypothetical protein
MTGPDVTRPGAALVLGMHRSGTSFVAGLVGLAGFSRLDAPDVGDVSTNPHGHQEVKVLADLNERLLHRLGGSWSAPPTFSGPLDHSQVPRHLVARSRWALSRARVPGSWFWKDPRLSLTARFWSGLIAPSAVPIVVLAWRDPLEVARSLERRNHFPVPLGLALWESYTRHALAGIAGRPGLCVRYDTALADPNGFVDELRKVAADLGVILGEPAPSSSVTHWADRDARHHAVATDDQGLVSPEQHALVEVVEHLPTSTPSFEPVTLPSPTPWAVTLIDERRATQAFHQQRLREERRRPRALARRLRHGV